MFYISTFFISYHHKHSVYVPITTKKEINEISFLIHEGRVNIKKLLKETKRWREELRSKGNHVEEILLFLFIVPLK